MAPDQPADRPPNYTEIVDEIMRAIIVNVPATQLVTWLAGIKVESDYTGLAVGVKLGSIAAAALIEEFTKAAEEDEGGRGRLLSAVVKNIFDADVSPGAFGSLRGAAERARAARLLTGTMIRALTGGSASIEPSDVPAAAYLNTVLQQSIESWSIGSIAEVLSAVIPGVEQIQTLGEVGTRVSAALGIGDSSSRVLRPYIDTLVVEPLRRHMNKTYRSELLGPGDTTRQMLRGRWTPERGREELARQGYNDDRIEALLNAQRKFFSASDVRTFTYREHWTQGEGVQHLRDQGYEEATAINALRLEGLKRIDQLEGQEAALILSAYAGYEIGHGEFVGLLRDYIGPPPERALLEELGELRRRLAVKRLSSADVARMVEAKILAFVDYRRALEREGFSPDAVIAKELYLRWELDKKADLEELRRQAAAERAAEQQKRDEEREKRKRDVEAARALARRGDESDLERAAIRGLIPFARVEEVYRARYDPDTVDILIELLEEARQAHIEAQAQRGFAEQRAASRAIDLGDVEQAVLLDVVTLDDYRRRLELEKFTADDVSILVDTLRARKRDLDHARRTRAEAEAAATNRQIDLGRFERLVRLGVRTLPQYAALLQSLGFGAAAIANMRELLEREIADDRKADEERKRAEARLKIKGLSIEEVRRAVLLGLQTRAQFEQFLITQGFTADKQILFLRELDLAVAEAETARQRRAQAEAAMDARELPLSTIARAARLGIVTPATYQARLVRAGYTPDDVAIELELLLVEIADVQAARQARDAAAAQQRDTELSLPAFANAVKRGIRSIDEFRARAVQLGLSQEAVETHVRVLTDELMEAEAARARRSTIDGELQARQLAIGPLEEAVKEGLMTVPAFLARMRELGYAAEDAELLTALLILELEQTAA